MAEFKLPTIHFGRRADASTGGADYYTILDRSPTIPSVAVELFERKVSKSVQWNTSAKNDRNQYDDCFLVWKIDDKSCWFARLSDAGNDSRGRPHAMQIDALYLNEQAIHELGDEFASFLAFLCHLQDWENCLQDAVCHISWQQRDDEKTEWLEKEISLFFASSGQGFTSLFIAKHPHYMIRNIDCRIDDYEKSHAPTVSANSGKTSNPSSGSSLSVLPPTDSKGLPPNRENTFMSKFRIVLLLLLFVGNITLGFFLHQSHSERTYLKKEIETKKQEARSLKSELNEKEKRTDELDENVKHLKTELDAGKKKEEQARQDLARTKQDLENATRNADQVIRDQIRRLRQEDLDRLKKFDSLHQNLGSLINEWKSKSSSGTPETKPSPDEPSDQ